MSINSKKFLREIKKEQLLSEQAFIDYCNFDYHHQQKLNINGEFLRAVEKDGFLYPLLRSKDKIKEQNGTEKEITINYYSPHQIYIIAALAKNKIHNETLWVRENTTFYEQQGFRMVNWGWGGMAFTITQMKPMPGKNAPKGYKQQPLTDIMNNCSDFNKFLQMLHSLEQISDYRFYRQNKERHFNGSPVLQFDFSPLKEKEYLKRFKLNLSKLKSIEETIAQMAAQIDPLESWYPYINRHPRWRKDLFKGTALLAQELYDVYDLVKEAIETISGEKEPSLLVLVHKDFHNSSLFPSTEYVFGDDIEVLFYVAKKFETWAKLEQNQDFIPKDTFERLESFVKEAEDYKNRYGDRSYASGVSMRESNTSKVEPEDLDFETKKILDGMMAGYSFNLDNIDEDIKVKFKSGKISLDEMKTQDFAYQIQESILAAIDFRLSSLKRKLYDIMETSLEKLRNKSIDAWTNSQQASRLITDQKTMNKLQQEIEFWNKKKAILDEIEWDLQLVFCSKCRKNFVRRHHSHLDQQISLKPICDECLKNNDIGNIKEAEWTCDFCGKLLYKFAYQNRINDLVKNTARVDLVLEYGRMRILIKCPNPECREENVRWVDWGWTD